MLRPERFTDPSAYKNPMRRLPLLLLPCPLMRQLPEQCASCDRRIATLESRVLPDGTQKRGAEVTFGESAEGGIRCLDCASPSTQE